jgi:hypothetical protein
LPEWYGHCPGWRVLSVGKSRKEGVNIPARREPAPFFSVEIKNNFHIIFTLRLADVN